MSSSFPNALDSLDNPSDGILLNSPSLNHTQQHIDANDAIEAIQSRLGIEGSSNVNSIEYRLNAVETASGTNNLVQDTSTNWYQENPILATNQIGVETDTLKIKVGTGANWNDIGYATITPDGLDNSLGDYLPVGARGTAGGVASLDSSGLIIDSEIPSTITRDTELSSHANDTTNIHGIADTSALATTTDISNHSSDTTNIHGIADTSVLATTSDISTHNSDTTNVHGISDTSVLLTTAGGSVENLTITGNLTISGTQTIVDTTNLDVTDSLIYLASEQFDTDVLDIGIFGAYGDIQSGHLHTGFVRDASDSKWKLISNAAEPNDNVINFTGVTYDTLVVGGLEVGNVSNTEISYLDGVTSSIQTQIDAKANSLIQFNQQSTSYTLQLSDKDKIVEMSGGGTLTIPAEASVNFPVGSSIEILQTGSSQVTIAGSGFTPNGTPGLKLRAQWSSASLVKRGSDLWIVSGDLSA